MEDLLKSPSLIQRAYWLIRLRWVAIGTLAVATFVFTVTLYLVVYMTTSISTQLRLHQEDLERANAQLQEKDQVKNEYVLRVTHDIKGHLATVQSCLDTVISEMIGPLDEKQKDMIGKAHRRTIKCMEFITALLKLTHMKLTGQLEMEHFSLRKTLFSTLALVQNRAQSKSIALHHHIDPAIDLIDGEAVLIEETITNILLNAVKYTPAGGKVEIEAKQDGACDRAGRNGPGAGLCQAGGRAPRRPNLGREQPHRRQHLHPAEPPQRAKSVTPSGHTATSARVTPFPLDFQDRRRVKFACCGSPGNTQGASPSKPVRACTLNLPQPAKEKENEEARIPRGGITESCGWTDDESGVSTAVTQRLLEHSSPQLTNDVYTNVDPVPRQPIGLVPVSDWL